MDAVTSKREMFIAAALAAETDECILWPFAIRKSSGYGAHSPCIDGVKRHVDVHRYVCELAHGPSDKNALHSCGKKPCINKRHLHWGTQHENIQDALRDGVMRGGGRHRQKLFAAERARIAHGGESILALAREYGMAPTNIAFVRRQELGRG